MNKSQKSGFAHVILLFVVAIIVLAGIAYFIFRRNDVTIQSTVSNFYKGYLPTATISPSNGLEQELDTLPDSDPSGDFSDVDKDISNL